MKKIVTMFFLSAFFLQGAVLAAAAEGSARETPIVKVVRENAGTVVNIGTERIVLLKESPLWGNYGGEFDNFFQQNSAVDRPARALKLKSVGSGVIVDAASGIIVTNAHVVSMASNVFVVLDDGTSAPGAVMYQDANIDLAIVKIQPPKPLHQVKLGKTDDLIIGETAIAIGNPLGLENSVTSGIISGKNRNILTKTGAVGFEGLIQTDTPINPGNSGGALLNLDGELIGISLAVVQNSQGIGFAIPVEKVKNVIEAYKRNRSFPVTQNKAAAPQARVIKPASGLDMEQSGDSYLIKFDVAGLDKNKINIHINNNSVTISGQRSEEKRGSGPNRSFFLKSTSSFSRTMPVPQDIDPQGVKTEIKGDTLIITLPKKNR